MLRMKKKLELNSCALVSAADSNSILHHGRINGDKCNGSLCSENAVMGRLKNLRANNENSRCNKEMMQQTARTAKGSICHSNHPREKRQKLRELAVSSNLNIKEQRAAGKMCALAAALHSNFFNIYISL